MPPDRDQAYLWDMCQAAQEVSDLVLHLSAEEFRENRLTRLAVERLLIILGEAAMSVSEQYRLQHPEISWQQIQRLRNRLAHTYGSRGARPHIKLVATLLSLSRYN